MEVTLFLDNIAEDNEVPCPFLGLSRNCDGTNNNKSKSQLILKHEPKMNSLTIGAYQSAVPLLQN